MSIAETDLVFLESERLDDSSQGGGRMTGNVIPDGQENNLFNDVGPGARITGRVFLREAFAANRSAATEVFLDAHLALIERPADPYIDVTLFSTGAAAAVRSDARDYIERYLTRSGYWPAQLYGDHLAGQRAVQLLQMPNTEVPVSGQTLVLIQDEGDDDEVEQYVRVVRTESALHTFEDQKGIFERMIVLAEISDPLRTDFDGEDPQRDTSISARTKIRDTIASSAAHYYGSRPLVAEAETADRTVYVDSLYTQLVPSAQSETPLVDLNAASQNTALTASGAALTLTTSAALSPSASLYLNAGILPGSLTMTTGGTTLTDNQRGELLNSGVAVGAIDYTEGVLSIPTGGPSYNSSKTCSWTPAAAPSVASQSAGIAVTVETRSLNWTITLLPIPAPGTLRVDYQVGGKWYRLTDRGDGGLVGLTSAHGVGSLNFSTGSVIVTCGALPDINSAILFFWANAVDTINRSAESLDPPYFTATLTHPKVVPGTVEFAWTVNQVAKTASDNALGAISGDATGTVDYETGEITLIPSLLPAPGTEISVDYEYDAQSAQRTDTFADPTLEQDGSVILTLAQSNVVAGSVKVRWNLVAEAPADMPPELLSQLKIVGGGWTDSAVEGLDLGNGVLSIPTGANGTINYTDGIVQFVPTVARDIYLPTYVKEQIGQMPNGTPIYRVVVIIYTRTPAEATLPDDGNGRIYVTYTTPYGVGTAANDTLTVSTLQLPLPKDPGESLVAHSARFTVGGTTYVERYRSLYRALNPATGTGTLAGSLDYGNGVAVLTWWAGNVAPAQTLSTLMTQWQVNITDETSFRVAIAPVRTGSVSVIAVPLLAGAPAINVTADTLGVFYQAGVCDGTVDYQSGVARIRWGGWVKDADLTPEEKQEVWYDENAVIEIDGVDQIFKPRPVYADTVKYNAVGYSYLPLSADIIGLDPVRLPSDGRVPCLQKGDVVLITHSTSHTVNTPQAGGTVDTELLGVARARVYDSLGAAVPSSRYSLAQDTGIVTWANPLDLEGYAGPYAVKAWIEDAALVTDVDLSGLVTLNLPLTHDYPIGALVSSALMHGDLYASVGVMFAQQAWTSVWSDERIGNPILAQYNDLLYPVQLTNAASWRERWCLLFTSSTSFRVIGEALGDITNDLGGAGYHDIDHDLAPINPLTNTPYFTLDQRGWGSGWVSGNVLRINLTAPANFPFWLAMSVQPSQPTEGQDQFRLLLRGGIDA